MSKTQVVSLVFCIAIILITGCSSDSEPKEVQGAQQPDGTVNLMIGYEPDAPVIEENEVNELGLTSLDLEGVKVSRTKTFSNGETFDYMVIDGDVIDGDAVLGTIEDYQGYFREYEHYLETGELPADLDNSEISTQGAMAKRECRHFRVFVCFERWGGGWPGGIVYYEEASITDNFTTGEENAIFDAMNEISSRTDVTFRAATTGSRIRFKKGSGCSSVLGRSSRQPQTLTLGASCFNTSPNNNSPLHELGHAIGLIHEHQRSDRDDFITVVGVNIKPAWKSQLTKKMSSDTRTAYDVDSVMHYNSDIADRVVWDTTRSIFVLKPGVTPPKDNDFGNDTLTSKDIQAINQRY